MRQPAAASAQLLPEDELKYVTVLFADIVGSTELVADLSPDEAQLLLTPAVKTMLDTVREVGGTINRVVGDGVLAFFGFPRSQEDHALRACCAAQRMHEEVAQLASPALLRIGLASGLALMSVDDETALGSHTAFGVTVHLAARLQSMARPGTSLCSAETKDLASPVVEMLPLGRHAIRGLPIEQELFEVVRVRQGGQRSDPAADFGVSPYVGRRHEFDQLQHCASTMLAGSGVVTAAIVGDAGLGKTRLIEEFAASPTLHGWRMVRAEAISYGHDIPYLLMTALLRSCFGVDGLESTAEYEREVTSQIPGMVGGEIVLATALLSLLDLPLGKGAAEWEALDPLRRRDALRKSIAAVVRSVASRAAMVLVIEDLHWADQESLRVLDGISIGSGSLLLVVTYRTGFEPLWTQANPTVIGLAPLSQGDMQQLLHSAFPELVDNVLQQEVIARAAGNPFFLEEMARSAMASGAALAQIAGRSPASSAPIEDGAQPRRPVVPATIGAVLAERIDRLDPDDKRVLRAASALGSRFSHIVLVKMFSDRPLATLLEQLARLRANGLLRRERAAEGEDGFAHALIQEVTYSALPRERRRNLHARITQTIAAIDPDYVTDQAEMLAFHAFRGEVWDVLAVQGRRAGQRAAGRSAYREAAAFFEQAITAYEHLSSSDHALAEQIDLRFELRNALFPTSSIGRSLVYSQQAEWLALKLGDRHRRGWATAFHARDLTLLGRPSEGLRVALQALEVAGSENEDLTSTIQSYIALAAYYRGEYQQSAATLHTLVSTVEARDRMLRLGMPGPALVFFRGWLVWALARLGQDVEAEAVADLQRQLAEDSMQPLCVTVAHLARGFALAHARRLEEARDELQTAVELCRKWEFYAWFTNIASCLGHVLSCLGDYDAGIDLLGQAIERTRTSGILVSHAHELAWLAEAFDKKGDHEEAIRQADRALTVALSHEERGNEALARVVLAEALAKIGREDESRAQFHLSLEAAGACRMAPLVLRGRTGLCSLNNDAHCTA